MRVVLFWLTGTIHPTDVEGDAAAPPLDIIIVAPKKKPTAFRFSGRGPNGTPFYEEVHERAAARR